jgi:acyl carrier protein phosphodiesterase
MPMNFLAHIFLSGDRPKIMVGNFIGDFVKGRNLHDRFDHDVVRGIELHRSIDEFTDGHPVVIESKKRLRSKYRHYAGVIVDVFYDHYLAVNWSDYHPVPLPQYAANTYQTLNDHHSLLPTDVQHLLPYMIHGNWLVNYGKVEGIQRALTGISRRTKFDSRMDESVNDLREFYDEFGHEFTLFFPELHRHAEEFIHRINS